MLREDEAGHCRHSFIHCNVRTFLTKTGQLLAGSPWGRKPGSEKSGWAQTEAMNQTKTHGPANSSGMKKF